MHFPIGKRSLKGFRDDSPIGKRSLKGFRDDSPIGKRSLKGFVLDFRVYADSRLACGPIDQTMRARYKKC